MPLEELPRFFHTQCSALFNTFTTHARLRLLGEVDILAAEAFYIGMASLKGTKKDAKQKEAAIKEALLTATLKFAQDLDLCGEGSRMKEIADKPEWIVYVPPESPQSAPIAEAVESQTAAEGQKCNIIHFDETSGKALSEQATNAQSAGDERPKRVHKEAVIPWRDWQYVYAVPCASVAADRASAVAVLQSLACTYEEVLKSMPIEEYDRHGKIHIRATQRIEANTLVLLPCSPLHCKLQVQKRRRPQMQ